MKKISEGDSISIILIESIEIFVTFLWKKLTISNNKKNKFQFFDIFLQKKLSKYCQAKRINRYFQAFDDTTKPPTIFKERNNGIFIARYQSSILHTCSEKYAALDILRIFHQDANQSPTIKKKKKKRKERKKERKKRPFESMILGLRHKNGQSPQFFNLVPSARWPEKARWHRRRHRNQ